MSHSAMSTAGDRLDQHAAGAAGERGAHRLPERAPVGRLLPDEARRQHLVDEAGVRGSAAPREALADADDAVALTSTITISIDGQSPCRFAAPSAARHEWVETIAAMLRALIASRASS